MLLDTYGAKQFTLICLGPNSFAALLVSPTYKVGNQNAYILDIT